MQLIFIDFNSLNLNCYNDDEILNFLIFPLTENIRVEIRLQYVVMTINSTQYYINRRSESDSSSSPSVYAWGGASGSSTSIKTTSQDTIDIFIQISEKIWGKESMKHVNTHFTSQKFGI